MEFLLLDGFLLALAGGHFVCELYIYNIEYRGDYAIRIGLRDGIKRRVRGRGKDGRERERKGDRSLRCGHKTRTWVYPPRNANAMRGKEGRLFKLVKVKKANVLISLVLLRITPRDSSWV